MSYKNANVGQKLLKIAEKRLFLGHIFSTLNITILIGVRVNSTIVYIRFCKLWFNYTL